MVDTEPLPIGRAEPASEGPPAARFESAPVYPVAARNDAAGYFDSIQGFIATINTVVKPQIDALELRLRTELLQTTHRDPSAFLFGKAHESVVYKTPMMVYVGIILAVLLSLIALSR